VCVLPITVTFSHPFPPSAPPLLSLIPSLPPSLPPSLEAVPKRPLSSPPACLQQRPPEVSPHPLLTPLPLSLRPSVPLSLKRLRNVLLAERWKEDAEARPPCF